MNGRTVKLLNKYSKLTRIPPKLLKRAWNNLDEEGKVRIRQHLKDALDKTDD